MKKLTGIKKVKVAVFELDTIITTTVCDEINFLDEGTVPGNKSILSKKVYIT